MKLLAVPGPAPGPCEAKAALVHSEQFRLNAVHVSAVARCRARDVVMTISRDEKFPEDTADSLRRFPAPETNKAPDGVRYVSMPAIIAALNPSS
jgi:hypothetical protein